MLLHLDTGRVFRVGLKSRRQSAARRLHLVRLQATSIPTGPDDTYASSLVDFVTSGAEPGIVHPSLSISYEGPAAGYGLVVSAPIPRNTQLVLLPRAKQVSYDEDNIRPRLAALMQEIPPELWGAKLALRLVQERLAGDASPYAAYIHALPVGVAGVPLFFDARAVQAIQYPPVQEQISKRGRFLSQFTRTQLASSSSFPLPSTSSTEEESVSITVDINLLGWAFAIVSSRAFRTRGPSQPAALLPMIDMCNHSFAPNAEVKGYGRTGAVEMVTTRDLAPGEALTLCYGKLSNDFLLLDYGFLLDHGGNPYDGITIRFDLDALDAAREVAGIQSANLGARPTAATTVSADDASSIRLHSWQAVALKDLSLLGPGSNSECTIGASSNPIDPRLLAATRVLYSDSPAAIRGRSMADLGVLDKPLSDRNEVLTLKTLAGLAASALAAFPTSIEQDELVLRENDVRATEEGWKRGEEALWSVDLALAVRFRLAKKQSLSALIRMLGDRIQSLDGINMEDQTGKGGDVPKEKKKRGGSAPSPVKMKKGFGGNGVSKV